MAIKTLGLSIFGFLMAGGCIGERDSAGLTDWVMGTSVRIGGGGYHHRGLSAPKYTTNSCKNLANTLT